jgi:hypothetical protein
MAALLARLLVGLDAGPRASPAARGRARRLGTSGLAGDPSELSEPGVSTTSMSAVLTPAATALARRRPRGGRGRARRAARSPTSTARHSRCPDGGPTPPPPARALPNQAPGRPHYARPAHCRAPGDRLGPLRRTPGKQLSELCSHPHMKLHIFLAAPGRIALAATSPRLLVRQALGLGSLKRGLLDQDPLPLITLPGAAEPHHDRRHPAVGLRPPGQSGVAGRQERQMIHVRTADAHRPRLLHHQQTAADRPAHRASEVLHRRDHHQVRWAALTLRQPRACAPTAPARPSARDTPTRWRDRPISRTAAAAGPGYARHIPSRSASTPAPSPIPGSNPSPSRSSPSSRSRPAPSSRPDPAAIRPAAPAAATPRRPAHQSPSRTSAPPAPPPPPAPLAARDRSDFRRSRPPNYRPQRLSAIAGTTDHATPITQAPSLLHCPTPSKS